MIIKYYYIYMESYENYKLQPINDIKVTAMKLDTNNKIVKDKQKQLFGDAPFPNIYLCAMKGGGKTNLLAFIIKNLITTKTKLRIFSTTAYNDLTMKKLLEKLDKYGFEYEIFDTPFDKEGNDIIDKQYSEILKQQNEDSYKIEWEKSKFYYPYYIYVYDDMCDLLRYSKGFDRMFSRNRHIRTINITSNQYYNQISAVARQNINFLLLFKNIPEKKLIQIWEEKIGGHMSLDKFLKIYYDVTEEKYTFLYISDNGELRKNFNEQIIYK